MCIRDRRGTAHGLAEAQRHEVRLQLLEHTLGAAPVSYTHLDVYKRQVHAEDIRQLVYRALDCEQALCCAVAAVRALSLIHI